MFKRLCTTLFLCAAMLAPASCDCQVTWIDSNRIVAIYDSSSGQMIRCIMLGPEDSADLPKGERRIIFVDDDKWDEAFKKLGITSEQCATIGQTPAVQAEKPQ